MKISIENAVETITDRIAGLNRRRDDYIRQNSATEACAFQRQADVLKKLRTALQDCDMAGISRMEFAEDRDGQPSFIIW